MSAEPTWNTARAIATVASHTLALIVAVKNNVAFLLASQESPSPGDLDRALELGREAHDQLPEDPYCRYHSEFVSVELFKRELPSSNFDYYICGPPPMMNSLTHDLREWGVPDSDVHFESFGPASVKHTPRAEIWCTFVRFCDPERTGLSIKGN